MRYELIELAKHGDVLVRTIVHAYTGANALARANEDLFSYGSFIMSDEERTFVVVETLFEPQSSSD